MRGCRADVLSSAIPNEVGLRKAFVVSTRPIFYHTVKSGAGRVFRKQDNPTRKPCESLRGPLSHNSKGPVKGGPLWDRGPLRAKGPFRVVGYGRRGGGAVSRLSCRHECLYFLRMLDGLVRVIKSLIILECLALYGFTCELLYCPLEHS